MIKDLLILVPAKAASKRLERKNMQLLGGKPLLKWAIDSAIQSDLDADIIVSTEDQEVAKYVDSQDVEVLSRPKKLAVDPAGVVDVALYSLEVLGTNDRHYKKLMILLPTCPFRSSNDVQDAYRLFVSNHAKFLMSVSEYGHTPFSAMEINADGNLSPYFPEFIGRKSQEMPKAFRANGAIHILDVEAFKREKSYYSQPLLAYLMPAERSIDVDTLDDLNYANFLFLSRT